MTSYIDIKSDNPAKIAKNTVLLYGRMMLTMLVSLYTSRVVLNTLGVLDYGTYNVIGGVVSLLSIMTNSMSSAISRYLTFELGKGFSERLEIVFSTSLNVQFILSFFSVLLMELLGVWFLNTHINIPKDRLFAANCVLQFSIVTFVINLISVPYNAAIVAHEKMGAFAYIGIMEVLLKLCCVIFLFFIDFDKLIMWGFLLMISSFFVRIVYGVYCGRTFSECRYRFIFDKSLLKSMTSFAGWSLFGAGSSMLMSQGVNVLINLYFGVALNAARGIATQVEGAVTNFTSSFTTAINPQITKSYARGDIENTLILVYKGAKFSFLLLVIMVIPLLFETNAILCLWLKNAPSFSSMFVRLTLINTLVSVISNPLIILMLATGDIKKYQIVVGGLGFLVFIGSLLFYMLGFSVELCYYNQLFVLILQLLVRLFLLHDMVGLSIEKFLREVVFNIFLVSIFSVAFAFLFKYSVSIYFSLFLRISFYVFITSLIVFFCGMDRNEKFFFFRKSKSLIIKICNYVNFWKNI